MANRSKKHNKTPFGLATGKYCIKRKWKRSKYYTIKCNSTRATVKKGERRKYNNKLTLFRNRLLKHYNIRAKRKADSLKRLSFNNEFQDLYNMHKVVVDSGDGGLKFRLKRLSSTEYDGYRIISMNQLQDFLATITLHTIQCKGLQLMHKVCPNLPPVKLIREVRNNGLASVIVTECQGCKQAFKFQSSAQLPLNNTKHYDINVRAVWGTMVTGGGLSQLNEFMGTMNSPGMSQTTFSTIEQEIGDLWAEGLEKEMMEAGAEERRIAIEKGQFDDGIPTITVVADGGWSKRSHKHTYNALGGVGVIIGAETGKLLYIGVRNKHCYICNRAETSHTEPVPHRCFCNWKASSQAMEADIVLEGFLKAEKMHGLRYTQLIADGDSSVYAKIQENVPVWGRRVTKIECANHVCKCLRSSLEKLVEENKYYKGKGKLSKSARMKIASSVRSAIRLRSKENNKSEACKKLHKDIHNSVHHVFGDHRNCSDFCKATSAKNTAIQCTLEQINNNSSESNEETIPDVLQQTSDIWLDTLNRSEEEMSRGDCNINDTLDSMMIKDISVILARVAAKSSRLLGNSTTNLAESWMAIRSKFDGGKLYNRCNRGSWHSRCYGGALRKNLGPQWSTKMWEESTSTKAGKHFEKIYQTRHSALIQTKKDQKEPERKARRWKRKMESGKQSQSKKARKEYGENALEAAPDLSADRLNDCKKQFFNTHINLDHQRITSLELVTRRQSASAVWHSERKKRITSSNFGAVVKRNPKIKVNNLVKKLLYSSFKGNIFTRHGIQAEHMSIKEYICKKQEENSIVTVEQMGLVIDSNKKFLATSPDGKVKEQNGETGLLEIKNLLHNKPLNLYEAASTLGSGFCLKLTDKKLHLKKTHDYYYQIQGQMNITNLPWTDFVVRTEKPYQLFIERIYRDHSLWRDMEPKLEAFYNQAILPELAAPTNNTLLGIREPGLWYTTPKTTKKKTEKKVQEKASRSSTKRPAKHDQHQNPPASGSKPCSPAATRRGSRRLHTIKFVGRRISHKWTKDEHGHTKWYNGTVTGVDVGNDGAPDAVYEVLYDGDNHLYSIDNLYQDFQAASVKFIDL